MFTNNNNKAITAVSSANDSTIIARIKNFENQLLNNEKPDATLESNCANDSLDNKNTSERIKN